VFAMLEKKLKSCGAFILLRDFAEYGENMFGDPELFRRWLHGPVGLLEGRRPLQQTGYVIGVNQLKNILMRIE